jgi:hypothetical protein
MWSRISNVLKTRPGTPALETDDDRAPSALAGAYEQSPNPQTHEQENHNETFAATSPPASMSRNNKRNIFKRMSKVPLNENVDTVSKNTLTKKAQPSLQNIVTGACDIFFRSFVTRNSHADRKLTGSSIFV